MSDTSRPLAQWPDSPASASLQMSQAWLEEVSPGVFTLRTGSPQGRAGFVLQEDGTYAPESDTSGKTTAVLANLGGVVHMLEA